MQINDVQLPSDELVDFLRWSEMASRFREISQSRSTFQLLNDNRDVGDDTQNRYLYDYDVVGFRVSVCTRFNSPSEEDMNAPPDVNPYTQSSGPVWVTSGRHDSDIPTSVIENRGACLQEDFDRASI